MMASTRQPISNLFSDLQSQPRTNNPSMNMDDLLKNLYSDAASNHAFPGASLSCGKTVDDVWKEIVAGSDQRSGDGDGEEEMTLEDFLTKAGAVREEDVRVPVEYGVRTARLRGKRRAVEEPPLDKATQQKQRRMIKNRESAARSRERKQAYTVELECLVTQLEEENARLLRDEAEHNKERFKQLMENVIPVSEKRGAVHALRRVNSMLW